MLVWIGRVIFTIAFSACVLLFTFGVDHIRIDTNLNDLNPAHAFDSGAQDAIDNLSKDISQRFTIVIRGDNKARLADAKRSLTEAFNANSSLQVIDSAEIASDYLTELAPFQFNLLTDTQRQHLLTTNVQAMAAEAQRKLYQFSDGIRLVPFADDPLGWFSDYLLNNLQDFEETGEPASLHEGEQPLFTVNFTVLIRPYPDSMAEQQALYRAILDNIDDLADQYGVQVLRSGLFFFAVDSAQSAKADIQFIAVGSIVGVVALMLLVFRSLLPLTLSLSSIAIGIGFGILTSVWVFGSIHILTIVFGASLIGIVVDYSLHYFYHFLAPTNVDSNEQQSLQRDNSLGRAMALSVITSMIGYGALALSDLLLLQKVALFSCSGLILAWLSVMVLGPVVTKRPLVARQAVLVFVINRVQGLFARRPKFWVATGIVGALISTGYLATASIPTNDDPRRFFHVSAELIKQEQAVASQTQIYEPGRYFIVDGGSADDIYTSLENYYQALDSHTGSVTSVLDWIPSPAEQQRNYQLQQALYREEGVLEVFLGLLGIDKAQAKPIQTAYKQHSVDAFLSFSDLTQAIPSIPPLWQEHDAKVYSFVLIKKNAELDVLVQASQSFDNIRYINGLGSAVDAIQAQREYGTSFLGIAYGLIAIMLVLYYRQLSALLLLLIPGVASVITIAVLVAIGQAITVFHIMALFLVLGLGMDYIIFAKEMQHKRAVTLQAILLSAVTSLLSFGLLAFSSMPIVQAFGSTILIANSINFLAAICLFNQSTIQKELADV